MGGTDSGPSPSSNLRSRELLLLTPHFHVLLPEAVFEEVSGAEPSARVSVSCMTVSCGAATADFERYTRDMAIPLTGMVHGNTVTLDATVPPLEGKRVLVLLEPTEEPPIVVAEQSAAWERWRAAGPQGPIEDDSESDFP